MSIAKIEERNVQLNSQISRNTFELRCFLKYDKVKENLPYTPQTLDIIPACTPVKRILFVCFCLFLSVCTM